MAGDNVGSWFAFGTIGSIITGAAAGVVPLFIEWEGYGAQFVTALVIASVIFALIALIAVAGFLNLVVRYLREISEQTGTWSRRG